jgi:hypothetical protein
MDVVYVKQANGRKFRVVTIIDKGPRQYATQRVGSVRRCERDPEGVEAPKSDFECFEIRTNISPPPILHIVLPFPRVMAGYGLMGARNARHVHGGRRRGHSCDFGQVAEDASVVFIGITVLPEKHDVYARVSPRSASGRQGADQHFGSPWHAGRKSMALVA